MHHLIKAAAALAACAGLACPAHAQSVKTGPVADVEIVAMTPEQWRTDLAFMAHELERRHPNPYHSVDRATFAAAVAALHERIPTLERHRIIVEMMRLAAMVGDGHTNISPLKDPRFGFRSVPLKLYWFDDGVHVLAASPEYRELVGARLDAIGGVPIEDALRRVAAISPKDNASGAKFYASVLLGMPAVAHALDLSHTPDAIALSLSRQGRSWSATVPSAAIAPVWPPDTDVSLVTPEGWVDADGPGEGPLWLQAPLEYHRVVELPHADALYIQLNMVTDTQAQSLAQLGQRILDHARKTNPARIVLDLRLNRGGNHDLRYPFISDLIRADDEDTRLFVLVGRGTFSASQALLDDLDQYTDAVLIGEPAASKPNSYGDSYKATLPNSGLTMRTSIYWHQLDQRDRPWTGIDVAAPPSFAAYASGRDPALGAALSHSTSVSLVDTARALVEAGD